MSKYQAKLANPLKYI